MFRWTVHLNGAPNSDYNNNSAVAVGNKVYFFGGSYKDQIDVHLFNAVFLRWMKLPPVRNGKGERPVEVPSKRRGLTAVLIEDIIYIWGGFPYCSMIYGFHVDTHRWFKLMPKISGTVPEGRQGHSASVLGTVMYIFGGLNAQTGFTNVIYKLDTSTMAWSLVTAGGTRAPNSSWHSANFIGTKMFVSGGLGHQESISVFDTETSCWLSPPSAQLLPEVRYCHSAFVYNEELYIFGGFCEVWNMWKYNPGTFCWTKVGHKNKGPCSHRQRMCCCMVGDHVIVFDDSLYILDVSPSLKTICKLAVIQYGLEQSGLPLDIRWELSALLHTETQETT